MASKQIGIKEKEQARKAVVSEMISSEVSTVQAKEQDEQQEQKQTGTATEEAETIESLKKQLEEARAALKIQSTRKTRTKDTRVNLLMYKDVYEALKEKCKKLDVSVNDCMNQLAEKWINE